MIAYFITIPIIAYLSMIAFRTMELSVMNFEGKRVPYSLGVVIIFSYSFLYAHTPHLEKSLSIASFIFVLAIWLLGLIDDVFGKPYPKGLKGHVIYFLKNKKVTTGLVKAIGTVVATILYLFSSETRSLITYMIAFLLLTGIPHVMNLFDTRPLRVWKLTLCCTIFILALSPLPSFLFVVMVLTLFYIWYVLEGYRKAMLGDNGATLVGAILAIVIINQLTITVQYGLLLFVLVLILAAEKYSFSALIENSSFLKAVDRLGVIKK
ncbi:hypothetical protein [Halalkalibacter krulwichiae]|uniref:Uncharacterized protein n=1 Tax=Halalkalibacter krulwichiae TaxID=199441 RepID=A0A1X9MIC1_9BACI|nr:hypothetical protein [Halalkalibacter krulwichiae]ARK31381.1 hypothetical protein BkAM31D_16815 [Halalkalibacter krulwichiae]